MRSATLLRTILPMCAVTVCAICCLHFRLARQRKMVVVTHERNNGTTAIELPVQATSVTLKKERTQKLNEVQRITDQKNGTQKKTRAWKTTKTRSSYRTQDGNKTQTTFAPVLKERLATTAIFSNFSADSSTLHPQADYVDSEPEFVPLCPQVSPLLTGKLNISTDDTHPSDPMGNWPPTLEEIAVGFPRLMLGGFYPGPRGCKPRNSIAIIVPYRTRERHLRYFLQYTHGILQRQQSRYIILVAEQDDDQVFNKGQLMNAAYLYLINKVEEANIDCVFFHDVDIISEDDRNLYQCQEDKVVHLASHLDKYNYEMCCGISVGGVVGLTRSQFEKINGFSNQYYGWGGEDDDMQQRIRKVGKFEIYRPSAKYNRFRMIKHKSDTRNPKNPQRTAMLAHWRERQDKDGLNSLQPELTGFVRFVTHTRIYVKSSPMAIT